MVYTFSRTGLASQPRVLSPASAVPWQTPSQLPDSTGSFDNVSSIWSVHQVELQYVELRVIEVVLRFSVLISGVAGTNIKLQTLPLLQLRDDVKEVFHRWIA